MTTLDTLKGRFIREFTCRTSVELRDAEIDVSGLMLAGGTIAPQGTKLYPDSHRAYLDFRLAHAFPVVSTYATSFHPGTLKNSFASMLHQQFNYGHQIREYYKDRKEDVREDRILGAIIAVGYPREPMGGWTMTEADDAPGLRCVTTVAKMAKGMDRVLGQYQTGRHDWTVSLEVQYEPLESGVLMIPVRQGELGGKEREEAITDEEQSLMAKHTPAIYARAGLSYIPVVEAPDTLISCFDTKKGMWSKPWKGNRLVMMMGGIDGSVNFQGTGLVQYGAEPAARIEQVLAEDKGLSAFSDGLNRLSELLDRLG